MRRKPDLVTRIRLYNGTDKITNSYHGIKAAKNLRKGFHYQLMKQMLSKYNQFFISLTY